MAVYRFIVLTNPKSGQDDEYNEWYSNTHIQDVTRIPGVVAAQRFKWVARSPDARTPVFSYAAIYEVETDDVEATFAKLSAASGTDAMILSPALGSVMAEVYEPITPRVTAS